jgi:hypothetical protein
MRRASLLAALLLLVLLAALRAAAGLPVLVYGAESVYPSQNGRYVSLSASGGGGGELEGGYGAVIEAEVAPLVGAPYWGASGGSVTVWVDDVSYTVTVKVFFISPSTGLGEWRDFASAAGSTYTQAQWVFTGYAPIRPVEYWKVHEWTLPSSGDYPARVRVDFTMSAEGWAEPNLKDGAATVAGGGYGEAWKKGGTGTVLPLAQLSVSSTPVSVTISYSGTVSGSATTPFTLYGVGRDLSVTPTAPRAAQHCVWVMLTVAP